MFSYRHAFHAGSHADVLKHTILIQLIDYMTQKDKPVMVVDTHAGASLYELNKGYAAKSGEASFGIDRLWVLEDMPPALLRYMDVVSTFNPEGVLNRYPGSPWIVARTARRQDQLRLFELHSTDIALLDAQVQAMNQETPDHPRRVMMQATNGFDGVKAFMPPPSRRGLVLIDPSYEDKQDYAQVVVCVQDILQRLPNAVIAVWYPVLARMDAKDLPRKLSRLASKDWLNFTLNIGQAKENGMNLVHSGLFVLNPPFNLREVMKPVMPFLLKHLKTGANAAFKVEAGSPRQPLVHSPHTPHTSYRSRKLVGHPDAQHKPFSPKK